jgi:hypothetical protein
MVSHSFEIESRCKGHENVVVVLLEAMEQQEDSRYD